MENNFIKRGFIVHAVDKSRYSIFIDKYGSVAYLSANSKSVPNFYWTSEGKFYNWLKSSNFTFFPEDNFEGNV